MRVPNGQQVHYAEFDGQRRKRSAIRRVVIKVMGEQGMREACGGCRAHV